MAKHPTRVPTPVPYDQSKLQTKRPETLYTTLLADKNATKTAEDELDNLFENYIIHGQKNFRFRRIANSKHSFATTAPHMQP